MRVLVTGCSGRLGDALVGGLLAHPLVRRVVGTDVRPPRRADDKRFRYRPADIRDGVYLRSLLEEELVDTAYHLAFKSGDAERLDAQTINVDGTAAVLEAASKAARVGKLVLLSSVYAYGARRRKGWLIGEDEPLRAAGPGPAFWRRRMEERAAELLPDLRPSLQVSLVRACAVAGGGHETSSPILPFLCLPWARLTPALADPGLQCLALEEAVRALVRVLDVVEFRGPFNLVPDDSTAMGLVCGRLGGPRLRLPYPALWLAARVARRLAPRLGLSESAAGFLARPVLADNARLKRALGVEFRVPSLDSMLALAKDYRVGMP